MRRASILLAGMLLAWMGASAQSAPLPSASSEGSDSGPFRYVLFAFKPVQPGAKGWQLGLSGNGKGSWAINGVDEGTPIRVSAATLAEIAKAEPAVAANHCETKAKHIAQTGRKSILFISPSASCEFNYSDNQVLNTVAGLFLAMNQTLEMGAELTRLQRYDRLGLDAEMEALVAAQKDGSAIEIENIAPVLQALVQDDDVIDRVRRKAARLLQGAGAPVPAGYDPDSNDR
ncbi:MAG TPA: hypothetical protein VMD97_08720 [Candidatus Aquilonibacter sp.]|nr:hypothetical protein [Candidatus Aquilonibacter sp.]